jgi:hypothetical protein
MAKWSNLLGGGGSLGAHLERLRLLLDGLGARLRDGVARAVGQTVAAAVQETVDRMLDEEAGGLDRSDYPRGWYDEETLTNGRYDREPFDPDYDPYEDRREPAPFEEESLPVAPSRWGRVLALGCQAAVWWLRRQRPRFPVAAAVGVGLASAVAVYAGGPVLLAGVGVGGSALSLALLADSVREGAAALYALRRR